MHSERDGEPLALWQGAERSLPLSSLPPKPPECSTPVGSWAARYHPSSNLPHWQQLQRSQKATHFSLSLPPTVNGDCCDGRQNAHNYCIWCERHVLSICNREPRHQNPSIVHKARRNREFCLPPQTEPQDRAMPQREFQKSTAQHIKPVLGKRDELKSHARGDRNHLKDCRQPHWQNWVDTWESSSSFLLPVPPLFPHTGGSSWLRKSKSGELDPDRQRPTRTLWFSAMVTTVLHSDGDRHASSTLATANCAVPGFNSVMPLKWHATREPSVSGVSTY